MLSQLSVGLGGGVGGIGECRLVCTNILHHFFSYLCLKPMPVIDLSLDMKAVMCNI